MKYFFTSDYHLGHKNIIGYCNRPFKSLREMNNTIIKNHNSRVKENDVVFHIGDFCFKNSPGGKEGEGGQFKADSYQKILNGNMVFLKGNHDSNNSLKTIINHLEIEHGGRKIFLTHRPDDANLTYQINFVGHVHHAWKFKFFPKEKGGMGVDTILINVGVDVWRFMPVTFEEIINAMQKWMKENNIKFKGEE